MPWSTIYLILAIIVAVLGIWNLARKRAVFVSLIGILWFLFVLFETYVPQVYGFEVVTDLTVGNILQYLVIPVFLIIAFFTGNR